MQFSLLSTALILLATPSQLTLASPMPDAKAGALTSRATPWEFKIFAGGVCSGAAIYTKSGTTTTPCVNLTPAQQGGSVIFSASGKNLGGAFYLSADCKGKGYALPYNSSCRQAQTDAGFQGKFLSYTVFGSA